MKKTYYVSVARGEISQVKTASPWEFRVEATDEEIIQLREYFDEMYSSDWQSFWRAHVPYVQYHYDRPNDGYDHAIKKVYELIYELGDEEARQQIETMGVIQS
ncbi:hydrolase [Anoxybacillus sp. TBDG-1]